MSGASFTTFHVATATLTGGAPLAEAVLRRIAALHEIEAELRGTPAARRRSERQ